MSGEKHTAGFTEGPWDIGDGNEVFSVPAYRSVAMVCSHTEGKANAHLIAAAPDLFASLRPDLIRVAADQIERANPAGAKVLRDLADEQNAAISKATAGSQ